jgi:PKD repeat protein
VSSGAGFNNVGGAVYSGGTTATLSLSTVPSSMNGYQYRVIIGGSCTPQVISDTIVLTVLEKPEVMIHPDDAEECEDGTVIFTVNPGVTTLPAYQWQESTGGPFTDLVEGAPYNGVNNDTLMISGIISAMHANNYRVVISGSCIPDATSNDASLTVYEKPEIISQPTDETICEDGNTSFTVDAGVTTNPTYQWQVDQNSGTFVNVSGGFYSGQNAATLNLSGALAYMNGYKYRVIIGGYCTPADTSIEVTLTILEKPEVTEHPSNSLVCEGLETYFTVNAGVTALPVYEWQVDDGSGTFVPVSGAPYQGEDTDSLIITIPTSAMNGYIYRVRISGTCTPDAFSNSAFLFVQENPEVTMQPEDSTICENENAEFTVNAGVTTLPDYQWQVNDGSGWVNLTDAGKYVGTRTSSLNIFNGTADMSGNQYQVIISGECAPPVTSNPATLTVNLRPVINTQPVNSTICEGEVTSFNVLASGFGLTYEWQVDEGAGYTPLTDGGVYSGTSTPTLTVSGPDATYDGFRYRVIVNNYCGPQQSSMIATLTVNSPPSVVTNPVDVAICEFTNTTLQVNAQGGGLGYQWQENDGGGWADIPEAGNYVGTNTPSLSLFTVDSIMTGYQYRAIITGVCAPPATTAAATLTVNTSPEITMHPVDMDVCETLNAQFSVTAIGDGLIYRWQENNGGGFADIPEGGFYSGTNTATLTINAPVSGMNGNTYRVIVSGTCVPPRTSNFAMLTIHSFPSMITQPVSDEICEDGNVTFIAAANGTGISYQWQENSGSGWSDVMDGGIYSGATTPTFTLTNVPVTYNGYQYRLNVVGTCAPLPSDVADLIVNANPVASITGDGNFPVVCGGIPMTLDGNPSGGSGTWSTHVWSGDIFPINPVDAQETVFQTPAHGSYNLTYTVTDSKGCIAKDQVTIENDRPDARFTSNASPSCGTLTVNYTNQSNRALLYEWDFDDPLNPGKVTDESPSYDFSNFTTSVQYFNVELVAFSMNGCTDTAREVVTIYPSIDASFTVDPPEGCNPVTVEMVSTPGGSNYYWDFGDGNAKNGSHYEIHQFGNLGTDSVTYTVSLTTTSFYGCFDTKTMPVTVYPIPQVNFTADPIIQRFPNSTVEFNNLTPNGSWNFIWDFDDGNSSSEVAPTHTYSEPGNYSVVLTASTAQCEDSIVHLVTVEPAAPIADFAPPEPGCAPLEINFQNNSQFATSYVWDFGNGSTSFKANPTFTYYESGTYAVTLTVFGPGGTESITHLVEVKITPNAYTTVAPTYVFANDVPVKCFNLTTDTSNCTYLWEFGDGESSNVFEPAHVFKEPGRYDITLTATNGNGCSSAYVFSYVEVEPAGELLFPNVFKPNPDGPSGGQYVEGQDNNQVFFPGVYDQVIQYELVIYNRWGELIFQSNDVNIGWDGYIDGKMMAQQGVYVWKVTGKYANGKSFVHVGDITLLR